MYPPKKDTVDILLATARMAGEECSSDHPEDIAVAMSMAIESAGRTVELAWEKWGT